jgi:viroplasmin and RNaseH domain-containing protein
MPKATKPKFYAVRVGREGPKTYLTWDEVSVTFYWTTETDSKFGRSAKGMWVQARFMHPYGSVENVLKTERYPGAVHKSFTSKDEAEQWLQVMRLSEGEYILPCSRGLQPDEA